MKVSFQLNDIEVLKENQHLKPIAPSNPKSKEPVNAVVIIPKHVESPAGSHDLDRAARKFAPAEDARERYLAQNTQCKISTGSSQSPKPSNVRRKSSVMIGQRTINFGLRINYGNDISIDDDNPDRITKFNLSGVDLLIENGNGMIVKIPLPVDIQWNAQKQRAVIDGKMLNGAKIVRRGNSYGFEYDSKELKTAVDHHIWALLYKYQNRTHEDDLTRLEGQLKIVDRDLNYLKQQGRLDAKTKKSYYSALTKTKRQKNRFTQRFQGELRSWESDYDSLKRTYDSVKKHLDSILWNWWYKHYTAPRPAGGC